MKKFLMVLILPVLFIFFQGCYTVLWTPDRSMPDYYETNNYYYYDDVYVTYYDYPWWVEVAPAYNSINEKPERREHDRTIRNSGSGRNQGSSRDGIIKTGRPGTTVDSGTGSSGSSSGSSERRTTTEDNSSKNSERSSSGNNDKVRNTGSDRNSGGRR